MRETPLSNCEREFIIKCIAQNRRLDGRSTYDYKDIRIAFGISLGCCHVELGKTRVLAQVSCEVGQPKQTRPHDGVLFVNVEMSPMACPSFEAGRQSEEGVELSRLMERCLKESRCMDLESLCIVAGEKAWQIRVDIHVLNHEGNILDCSSIAAIAALAHFRRPDVTVQGEEIRIHSMEDRNPVPLSIHHFPLLVSFAFFSQGKFMLVDPSEKEEKVMEGKMVIGMNKHREICTLQVTGQMLLLKEQVLRCSNIAVSKVSVITELIFEALENDRQARLRGEKHGFAELVSGDKITSNKYPVTEVQTTQATEEEDLPSSMESGSEEEITSLNESGNQDSSVCILAKGVGVIGEGGPSKWIEFPSTDVGKAQKIISRTVKPENMEADGETSEEDCQVILEQNS
ncbi:Exosome complex component RRP45 [Bulinus truncatus]|nr:Exosome complex component RRP45 [Bulinus truncatus]